MNINITVDTVELVVEFAAQVNGAAAGSGDMQQSVYDIDGDGVVNDSHRLAGQLASYYASAAAVATALASKADLVSGLIPTSQLPALSVIEFLGTVPNQAAMLALNGQRGDWCNRADESKAYILFADSPNLITSWAPINYPAAPVLSVNGQAGTVVLGKTDISLSQVDNTSDIDKPVSSAQSLAIAAALTAANAYTDSVSVKKNISANFLFSSSSAATVSELTVQLLANCMYDFRLVAHVGCDATGGVRVAVNTPSGSSSWGFGNGPSSATTAFFDQLNAVSGLPGTAYCRFITTNGRIIIEGTVVTTTAGDLSVVVGAGTNTQQCYLYSLGTCLTVGLV
jgi:hypothetical protein